jgi:hypothetical protein
MNEHRRRIHDAQRLTPDEFLLLETCQATKHSKHSSYCAVVPTIQQDDFRHESLFEMRVGLLKFSTVFYEGEARVITMDCKRFFNQARTNPLFEAVLEFLKTARSLCNSAGSDLVRQQAMRNADGAVTTLTFRPVETSTVKKYAHSVADLLYFATQCPWDHDAVDLTDVPSMLSSIFFERQRSIQHNFMTR